MSPYYFRVDCFCESVESSRVSLVSYRLCLQGRYESGEISQLPVPDPDLEIRRRPEDKLEEGGGGGRGGGDGLQKIFFRPFGPQSGLKIRWGRAGDPGPLPLIRHRLRNTTAFLFSTRSMISASTMIHILESSNMVKKKIKRFPQQNPSRPLLASVKSPRLPASAQITCG